MMLLRGVILDSIKHVSSLLPGIPVCVRGFSLKEEYFFEVGGKLNP